MYLTVPVCPMMWITHLKEQCLHMWANEEWLLLQLHPLYHWKLYFINVTKSLSQFRILLIHLAYVKWRYCPVNTFVFCTQSVFPTHNICAFSVLTCAFHNMHLCSLLWYSWKCATRNVCFQLQPKNGSRCASHCL